MNYRAFSALTVFSLLACSASLRAADIEKGFIALSDGKSFEGWKSTQDHTNTWKIEEGAFVSRGETAHLFYDGPEGDFTNFDLKVDVMTGPGSNGGIYFHTKYQERGFPKIGFECQVNNTQSDWRKTGSLYNLVDIGKSPAQDNKWWTQEIIVKGNKVTVKIDGEIFLEYYEPAGAQPGRDYTHKLASGTFAFQAHDPKSVVRYKNIRVKRLD